MTININLTEADIQNAIIQLNNVMQNLRWGVQDTVETIARDGEEVAQAAYGGMANVTSYSTDENVAIIAVTGEANLIAEFGAGDATIPGYGFENTPDTPTYARSYSESEDGSGMYAELGWWKFGGTVYREIEPRMGLAKAKAFIISSAENIAKEVIKL